MSTLNDAIQKIRTGNIPAGRQILEELLDADENNEQIWLWMSTVVDSDEDREICLENALALDPENIVASKGLEALRSGIFNANDLLRELLDEEDAVDEPEPPPLTFVDEFNYVDEDDDDDFDDDLDFDDDDLPLPGSKKKSGGLNVRFIILGVLIVGVIVVLAALAAASFFMMAGDGPSDTPPLGQETPAQGGESQPEQSAPEATATATETPTPGPTDTPTMTPTSKLQLPTLAPTDLPTPIATRVVSPTPAN
jgi:hypothetical protein